LRGATVPLRREAPRHERPADRDPRMAELHTHLLDGGRKLGGRTICMWNSIETYSKWGSWGLVECVDRPRDQAPKLDATLQFAQEHKRWW
jgi:hypothetical protein